MRVQVPLSGFIPTVDAVLTSTKGNTAEAQVLAAFVRRGFHVLVPFGDGQPYDLVVHLQDSDTMLRVQCKSARARRDCAKFNARTTDHGRGRQSYVGSADVFGIYFAPTNSVYLVPVDELPGFEGNLRLQPARNNQRRRIRMAEDYEIDRWSAERLARLGSIRAVGRHP